MISVIVPFYNSSKYINECIQSILNQTYNDFELLLINDGSEDDSLNICKEYKDKRIRIFNRKHNGVSCARNYGLSKARGEYVCFIDSDDIVHRDYLNKLYNNMNDDVDFVECDFSYEMKFSINNFRKSFLDRKDVLYRMYSSEGIRNNLIVNKLFRKKLFDNLEFENVCHEDEFIIHKIFNITNKAVIIGDVLYYYRIHDNSRQRSVSNENIQVLKVFDERGKLFNDDKYLFLNYCAMLNHIIYLYCVFYKYKNFNIMRDLHKLFLIKFKTNEKYSLKLKIKYYLFRKCPRFMCGLLLFKRRYKYA